MRVMFQLLVSICLVSLSLAFPTASNVSLGEVFVSEDGTQQNSSIGLGPPPGLGHYTFTNNKPVNALHAENKIFNAMAELPKLDLNTRLEEIVIRAEEIRNVVIAIFFCFVSTFTFRIFVPALQTPCLRKISTILEIADLRVSGCRLC